ncbi:hypothetical protein ACOME3_000804 [Neoechinorhynchus agilis]
MNTQPRFLEMTRKLYAFVNLKPCKTVTIQFDPFHEKTRSIRDFLTGISKPKVRSTNALCSIRTRIKSDSSDPQIHLRFVDDEQVILKTENMTAMDIVYTITKFCNAKTPASTDDED